jgi:hypothetical protein
MLHVNPELPGTLLICLEIALIQPYFVAYFIFF